MHLGGTVARNKFEMSAAEFGRWCEYFNKHGRCGPVRMWDRPAALLASKIDHVWGVESKLSDYLPYYEEPEATVEEIFKEFGGIRRRG